MHSAPAAKTRKHLGVCLSFLSPIPDFPDFSRSFVQCENENCTVLYRAAEVDWNQRKVAAVTFWTSFGCATADSNSLATDQNKWKSTKWEKKINSSGSEHNSDWCRAMPTRRSLSWIMRRATHRRFHWCHSTTESRDTSNAMQCKGLYCSCAEW